MRLDDESSIQKIQETYKDTYSREDFDTASEEIAGTMMRKMLTSGEKEKPNFTLDKTYRNFLDEAKEKLQAKQNAEKERIRLELEAKRQELIDAVSLMVVEQGRRGT